MVTFVQVGAHGTDIRIPVVDDLVVSLKIATLAVSVLYLAVSDDSEEDILFCSTRTVLRLFGVVAVLTVHCVHTSALGAYASHCDEETVLAVSHKGTRWNTWRKQRCPPMIRIASHPRYIQRCTRIARSFWNSFQRTDGQRACGQHCQARHHVRFRTPVPPLDQITAAVPTSYHRHIKQSHAIRQTGPQNVSALLEEYRSRPLYFRTAECLSSLSYHRQ